MTIINRQWRVLLIAIAATVCAVGLVRAEAQGQVAVTNAGVK